MTSRPTASVIVPFAGPPAEMPALAGRLRALSLAPGDELLIAYNGSAPRGPTEVDGVPVVPAPAVPAPGYARNRAAEVATGAWLVFIDADTVPEAGLVDAYLYPPPRPSTAILAGAIVDAPVGSGLAARHSAARGHMSQRVTLDRAGTAFAKTANCAIRREAFIAVGGFDDTIRAGEDADLCFRLLGAGWELEERPRAAVEHRPRTAVPALLTQLAVHGAGAAWLERRYPGEFPRLRARQLAAIAARKSAAAGRALARGESEPAAFALLDFVTIAAFELGRLRSNAARQR